jgi:uncharacterized protein YabE (DUF348 family)
LPRFVAHAIRPSPARAVPYDPDAWLPVPDPASLPALDEITLDALVSPSPARAEPHDAAAWLPLPADVASLPSLDELLAPPPELRAAVVDDAEAVVREAAAAAEAAVAPSPARAEPHDPDAWLPVPDPDLLRTIPELSSGAIPPARPRPRRGSGRFVPSLRSLFLVVLVVATVAAGVRAASGEGAAAARVRAFAVTVDLDGAVRTVHTTERGARGLARALGVGKLVAVRNIPGRLHAGSEVVLRTRHTGVLVVDGQSVRFDSPSATVDELLASYSVTLVGEDYTEPARDARLVDGQSVEVLRVGGATKQTTEAIPFTEESQGDPAIPIGETSVIRPGVKGELTTTYRERIENGVVVGTTVLSRVRTAEPVSQINGYGTKADWHWDALATCESGRKWATIDHTPDASDLFDGGLGIARSTWAAFGGREFAPNAGLATREEQIVIGQRIYDTYGWWAWGCAVNVLHWV